MWVCNVGARVVPKRNLAKLVHFLRWKVKTENLWLFWRAVSDLLLVFPGTCVEERRILWSVLSSNLAFGGGPLVHILPVLLSPTPYSPSANKAKGIRRRVQEDLTLSVG